MKSTVFAWVFILVVVSLDAGICSAGRRVAEGDFPIFMQEFFECREGSADAAVRKECEAKVRYELGLIAEAADPGRAALLYEAAIRDSKAFAPPYFALARLSLDPVCGTEELFRKLNELLSRAPEGPELLKLKARLEGRPR